MACFQKPSHGARVFACESSLAGIVASVGDHVGEVFHVDAEFAVFDRDDATDPGREAT
jgi:hypothetical protein